MLQATVDEFNRSAQAARTLHSARAARPTTATRATSWCSRIRASRRWSTALLRDQARRRRPRHFRRPGDRREDSRPGRLGKPIKGLHAVGNDAASVMGGNYPGAGITLGPALTFGYIAGRQLASRRNVAEIPLTLERRQTCRSAARA